MLLRYSNELHVKLLGKLESHSRLITGIGYLNGNYRSHKLRFSKEAGSNHWLYHDKHGTTRFGFAEEPMSEKGVEVGDFFTMQVGGSDEMNAKLAQTINKDKDDLYVMMVSYLMSLFATTKGIEDKVDLVVCLIWSTDGGCLFIDNYRIGVDNLGYEIHPYVRAGWDAELVNLVPDGCMYVDENTRAWMRHFHQYMRDLQIDYDLSYGDSERTWYARLSSPAPAECFLSRDRASVASATEDCLRHIGRMHIFAILEQCGWTAVAPYPEAV